MRMFTCGCCGSGFRSTIEEQRKHDQDTGYGICPECDDWISERNDREWTKLRDKVADALSETNRATFLDMDADLQRSIVGSMIEEGVITCSIAGR